MKILTKNSILGTSLVALAILNFSVLDQIGHGLVTSVNETFEDLGADWIGLQTTNDLQTDGLVVDLAKVAGANTVISSTSWSQVTRSANGISGVEWLIPGTGYDLQQNSYLFIFQEDEETGAQFYRDAIQWEAGSTPQPGGFASSSDYALEQGLNIGDTASFSIDGNPFSGTESTTINLTLDGIYQRSYTDESGSAFDVLILSPEGHAATIIQEQTNVRETILIQATLASILQTSDAIVDEVESQGYTVGTDDFQIGGRTFGGRTGGDRGQGGFGGQQAATNDFALFANGEVLADALDAADRAGSWFRMLTTSAVVMALVGIAFVTAAMEKKVRRDVGIRQAVGYPVNRIWSHWALMASTMGVVGGAIGVAAVAAIAATGLSDFLLGIPLNFQVSAGAIMAPIASMLVFAAATFPTYAKVLRSAPADNLQALSE